MRKASLLAGWLALMGLAGHAAQQWPPASPSYELPRIFRAPEFSLANHLGGRTRLSAFRGRVVLLTFVYVNCPGACPLVTGKLHQLHRELKQQKGSRARVQLLSVTVDPRNDTPVALATYARNVGVHDSSWLFLTGSEKEVERVLDAYDLWRKKLPSGLVDHVMRVYLIDRRGHVREIYNNALLSVDLVLQDIRTLE